MFVLTTTISLTNYAFPVITLALHVPTILPLAALHVMPLHVALSKVLLMSVLATLGMLIWECLPANSALLLALPASTTLLHAAYATTPLEGTCLVIVASAIQDMSIYIQMEHAHLVITHVSLVSMLLLQAVALVLPIEPLLSMFVIVRLVFMTTE